MTLDSRDTQKHGEIAESPSKILVFTKSTKIFATFYVTSRLHEQF